MKKLTILAFVLIFALSLVSCGGTPVEKGATISFGGHNWIVLEVIDGNKALILSDRVIELRPYHSPYSSISWEKCELRQYLNGEFYEKTFSAEEKRRIIETEIGNKGNNTKDKIFLLSSGEVSISKYFKDDSERITLDRNTAEVCWWWLRSPGSFSYFAAYVDNDGDVTISGIGVDTVSGGVRPALWLKLEL
jgi:predicted cupin superfamily sugar epimerase